MNLARNTHNRLTARPPRDIRGYQCPQKYRGFYAAVCALALLSITPVPAFCQMGQAPMQNDGLVNNAARGIGNFKAGGAGRMYYGVNGADRGLGYRGSYMTLGGYFPALEDDYGGLWAADTRGHLSNYGGFFSNVGVVRKQLLNGGSLLGFGLFWDYDGDQNQYEDQTIGEAGFDPMTFSGGYSYNQVGVSGELLTDWGNIRSNGYIPVGKTGQSTGKYVSTNILCVQGINAALGGADLELGAYLPGLADWAGMINVGGYAYGNTRYQLDTGANLVPWFGGVYTRIDMTFADNWDFSLQYNNDSYFDSTGFARLTYRLGGSRRRNVPDQMEQPMMRNEHIVRAHQNAMVCMNPITGQPWRIIHVDNETTSPATGNGSIINPLASLGGNPPGGNPTAETIATEPYDIIFVHSSSIAYNNTPADAEPPGVYTFIDPTLNNLNMFTLQNSNQYLVGEGSSLRVPTTDGSVLVSTTVNPALYPTLAPNPNNSAVFIPPVIPATITGPSPPGILPLTGGTIDGLNVTASGIGIHARAASGLVTLGDLNIRGGQTGLLVEGNARYDVLEGVAFSDQNGTGLENNGSGRIQLTGSTFTDIRGTAIETKGGTVEATQIVISNTEGDGIIVGGDNTTLFTMNSSIVRGSRNTGIIDSGGGSLVISGSSIDGSGEIGFQTTLGSSGSANFLSTTIDGDDQATPGIEQSSIAGIQMQGTTAVSMTALDSDSSLLFDSVSSGNILRNAADGVVVTGNSQFSMNSGRITNIEGTGIELNPTAPVTAVDGSAILNSVFISGIGDYGIRSIGNGSLGGGAVSLIGSSISSVGDTTAGTGRGIDAFNVGDFGSGASIAVVNSAIQQIGELGITVNNSNLRVESSTIGSTGTFGIESNAASTTLISTSRISDVGVGIQAVAGTGAADAISFPAVTDQRNRITILNNRITADSNGIILQGAITANTTVTPATMTTQSILEGNVRGNQINATSPISLVTQNGIVGPAEITTTTTTGGVTTTITTPAQPPQITGGRITADGRPQGLIINAIGRTDLQNLNNGATATETPTPNDPENITTSVDYIPGYSITPPPPAP
jgi:hypothetical protein